MFKTVFSVETHCNAADCLICCAQLISMKILNAYVFVRKSCTCLQS